MRSPSQVTADQIKIGENDSLTPAVLFCTGLYDR